MLKQLHIGNYALIDHLDITFDNGLTIITGETGAGKSIILGALSLIMGERADAKAIRDTAHKTVVEATFDLTGYGLEQFFIDNDIDWDEHECLVRREVAVSGRSRAFINDIPVQLGVLRELGTRLVDIHSQHNNMLLSQPAYQLSILDHIADNAQLLGEYRSAYQAYHAADKRLQETLHNIEQLRRNEDYIRFQLEQLQTMALQPDEDQQLETLQDRLANVSMLKEDLWAVENALNGEDVSILEQLSTVAQRLENAAQHLPEVQDMSARTRTATIELKDIAQTVSAIADSLNDDPQQLAQVQQRLADIYDLQRKHNVQDVNALLEVQRDYERQLNEIEFNDDNVQRLQEQVTQCHEQATRLAQRLSDNRRHAAQQFAVRLKQLAAPLGMKNIAFEVDVTTTDLNVTGMDHVEFMMAFNKNQQPKPVKDTASGGEISRVMLCIKTIIAQHMQLPTIIFDEVDTGVSGDIANRMGEMMADIAASIQVIAITHLPQVASHGTSHLRVFKTDNEHETLSHVEKLDEHEHVMEIARMLSGKDLDQAAIENAKSLINHNQPNQQTSS